jgi:aldehyde:ferredoxin oxidoreductase
MTNQSGGWAGQILRINVGNERTQVIPTREYSENLLGGLGIAARIAWDEIDPGINAFDAGNKLIFATGPLTGTLAPGSGRMEIVGKSPRTFPVESVTRSGMGGHWGVELKRAGYDAVILEGRADEPVYIRIDQGNVEFCDATPLWGMDTYSTQKWLKEKHGSQSQVVCIGPAGENKSRIATIITETSFSSGKSGFGAVMGTKKVKGIVVDGSGGQIEVVHPGCLIKLAAQYSELIGYNPMREWTVGYCPPAHHVRFFKKYRTGNASCFGCPMQCFAFIKVPDLEPAQVHCINYYYMKPAYDFYGETLEGDQAIWQSIVLCNKLGLCTFEMAGLVPWLTDLFKAGLIDEKDSGLPLRKTGSREFIEDLLSGIAFRKHIGDILAEGAPRAADMLPDAWPLYEKYYPAHGQTEHNSVRDFPAIALLWALDSRDPMIDHHAYRHLSVSRQRWPRPHQLPLEKAQAISEKIFGSKTAIDHGTYAQKSKVVAYCQNRSAVIDSLVLCDFLFPIFTSQSRPDRMGDTTAESKLLSAVTGIDFDEKALEHIGERIWNIQRAIMVREGRTPAEDTLHPSYFRKQDDKREAQKAGQSVAIISADHTNPVPRQAFEEAKTEYYKIRGWDPHTGCPTHKTLSDLGLEDIADELHQNDT